jgi:acyl-CoA thioesterase
MHIFDNDISVSSPGGNRFSGTVTDNWSINGNPNGGYLMALGAQAMMSGTDKKSTPIITANYISRSIPGETQMELEEFSRSKQFNRFQVKMLQDGKEKIRMLGTFTDEKIECRFERYETKTPDIAPLEKCIEIPAIPQYTIMKNLDIRLDPASAGWMKGTMSETSEMKGWVRFREQRPFDLLSVLLAADAFPPPVFVSQGMTAWVPTIELSVNVRNIPETEWVKGAFRTRFITCGLLESDGEIWDEKGNLVAISRQIAQFKKI